MKLSLKIRSRSEIDDNHWNQLVENSLQKVIYGFTWYLDTVCSDWVAVVQVGANGYEAIMPLPLKSKWGKQVIDQPLFCQFLGIFSKTKLPKETYLEFLNMMSTRYAYISTYSFNPHNYLDLVELKLSLPHLYFSDSNTYFLDLKRPYPHLFTKYSKDRKSNLKNSFKYNWKLNESTEVSTIIELFKDNHQANIGGGVSQAAYELLVKLCKVVQEHASLKVFYAEKDHSIEAGIVLFIWNGMVIYIFNAANDLGRIGNARTYMLDQFFQSNTITYANFDFESPEIATIANYYKSFGAEKIPFLKIHQNNLPFPLNYIQKFRRQIITSK